MVANIQNDQKDGDFENHLLFVRQIKSETNYFGNRKILTWIAEKTLTLRMMRRSIGRRPSRANLKQKMIFKKRRKIVMKCWWIFRHNSELSPCQILVVEGVDGMLPDRSHPYQRAVQTWHRCIHLMHVVVVIMLFRPVVHLKQQNMVKKVLRQFCTGQLSHKQLTIIPKDSSRQELVLTRPSKMGTDRGKI